MAGEVERDAVDVHSHQLTETNIGVAHQRQRREEVLAELAVSDPRFAFAITLERERVNQDQPATAELEL